MNTKKTITAKYSGGEYPLIIGDGLLKTADLLSPYIKGKQVMIVSNSTVAKHYLSAIEAMLKNYECEHFLLPDGEEYKTLQQVEKLWNALAEHHYHRDATIVALGGGVVGDMAGFAAACYQRGIPFIQIPTTLLAQTDASIGGKTAVDHPRGKNLIGAFHQPAAVIIDVDTLKTLPDRAYRAGLSEIIKHALIKDADFFEWLETHIDALLEKDSATIIEALERSCQIKCNVVAADEKEKTGERALLNLGHTFGHAIEQNLNFTDWLHGEAVALGILIASQLSMNKGWLKNTEKERIEAIFSHINMPNQLPSKIKCDTLLAVLWNDKKVMQNKLHFVALKGIGRAVLTTDVDEKELRALLANYK
ncbi:MAG: 3-dehydroquinate synthase [Coxiellaceae bacterium]|nr:3-dehydroquinate synthase [Coxiellaceae bacterium]